MSDEYFKKATTLAILILLAVLSFLLLKPILLSIVVGVILAFVFSPVYDKILNIVRSRNLAAIIVCFLLFLLILIPFWFLTPLLVEQSIKIYVTAQQTDFVTPIKTIFPSLFSSEEFSSEIALVISTFIKNTANSLVDMATNIIFDMPTLSLKLLVVIFTFFYVLRDKEDLLLYLKSLFPFSREVEKRIFDSSRNITSSVLYGQVVVGMVQGLIAGFGFFIFGVSNALVLTILACLFGIFPIVGTTLIWAPVAIYLFVSESIFPGVGVAFFGLISSSIDNILRPLIVSQRTKLHSFVILAGMIGGFMFFGFLGFILGPLVLSYLLILLEVYRKKRLPGIFIQDSCIN